VRNVLADVDERLESERAVELGVEIGRRTQGSMTAPAVRRAGGARLRGSRRVARERRSGEYRLERAHRLRRRTRDVAGADGGILGFGRISRDEGALLLEFDRHYAPGGRADHSLQVERLEMKPAARAPPP